PRWPYVSTSPFVNPLRAAYAWRAGVSTASPLHGLTAAVHTGGMIEKWKPGGGGESAALAGLSVLVFKAAVPAVRPPATAFSKRGAAAVPHVVRGRVHGGVSRTRSACVAVGVMCWRAMCRQDDPARN